jgi:Gamma-glutamyl cyclotransferase, AIG2-like
MPLYFAYGSNMDVNAMARRCPRSKALGLARLERHRLAVMREGWLTAARNPSSAVHGVLWDLALSDIAALDRHESLSQGIYTKETQPVIAERGPKRAIIYFGANSGPGVLRPAYFAEVVAAARSWPLPGEGLEALERLARLV